MIAHQLEHWQEHGYGWWAVELTTTGEFIGWCGLQFLPKTEETEVGYLLGKPCWGQGLATEGAQASLLYGFEDIGLKTVVAIVHPENIASQRVIEKLGMSFTGQARYFGMPCCHYTIERTSAAGPDCHSQGGLFHDD